VGGGPNFGRFFGLSGEFMWNNLPIKSSVLRGSWEPTSSVEAVGTTAPENSRPQSLFRGRCALPFGSGGGVA
jgi:hypothetical protein